MKKWTPEIVARLAKYVESSRYFTVRLRGEVVGKIHPANAECDWDGFEFGTPEQCDEVEGDIRPLRDYQPGEFVIERLTHLPRWWAADPTFPDEGGS